MKRIALCLTLVLAAVFGTGAVYAAEQDETGAAVQNAVTETTITAISIITQPTQKMYGLSAEAPEINLKVGGQIQLKVGWDADCYLPDSLRYESDHQEIAIVNEKGVIEALSEGTAVIRIRAALNKENPDIPPEEYGWRSLQVSVTVTDPDLNDAQRDALNRLKGIEQYRKYYRERAVIRGELAPDEPRLTPDDVNRYIDEADSFQALYGILNAVQKYPDVYESVESTSVVYWFDDRGTEGISVLANLEQIYRFRLDADGCVQETQLLYPERQETQHPAEKIIDYSFREFNEIYKAAPDGDVNGDGGTDVSDAVLAARFVAEDGGADLTAQGKLNADVNSDGEITADDVIGILKKIAKIK